MNKVGIMTIFRTGNYGATLQAFALKEAISQNGYGDPEIINYCCDAIKGRIDFKFIMDAGFTKTAAALVDKACYWPRMKKVHVFIDSFVSGPELSRNQLEKLNFKYDVFLTGSDQIWNPDIQQGDYSYLLDFVTNDRKKCSYGSSFGLKQIPEQYKKKYIELLSGFKNISVRETAGADIIENLLGVRPTIVVDPTLLLEVKQWESLLPKTRLNDKYIFAYRMSYSKKLTEIVCHIQKKTGFSVCVSPFLLGHCDNAKAYPSLSSLEWAKAIYDSSFVITDSFHGVVFAIMFSKPFYYVITSETVRDRLSRLETLLEGVGVPNRIIESLDQIDITDEIDYIQIQKKLEEKRKESLISLRRFID